MGLLFHESLLIAKDDQQQSVPSARLALYAANSETLVPLYQDPDLTMLQANPMTADARGVFPLCYVMDGQYQASIRDPQGNTLVSQVAVTVEPEGSQGVIQEFANGAELRADQKLTYSNQTAGIMATPGDTLRVADTGFAYQVAPESEPTPHLMTAGGVKLWVLPDSSGRYLAQAIDSGDIGADINALFAYGGDDTHVYVGPGQHPMATTINMNRTVGSHLVLEGAGHLTTTFILASGASTIGIDMSDQDESVIRELRVKEDLGGRSCLLVLVGGTSARVTGVWAGNSKYGFVIGGANPHMNDTWAEACDYGTIIASRFADFGVGMTTPFVSVTAPRLHQHYMFNCGAANQATPTGLLVTPMTQANVSAQSGSFADGETVTGSVSGSTATVWTSNDSDIVTLLHPSGDFSASETLTGGTSGASATVVSTQVNAIRDPQFTQIALTQNDRWGAVIDGVEGLYMQGTARRNGTNASHFCGGLKIGSNVIGTLNMDLIDNGPQTTGHGGLGYGVYIDGDNDTVVNATGGFWGNSQDGDQDHGFYLSAAELNAMGVDLSKNAVSPYEQNGSGADLKLRACAGTADVELSVDSLRVTKRFRLEDIPTEMTASYGPITVNNTTAIVAQSDVISVGKLVVWECWQTSAGGLLQSFMEVYIHNDNGQITANVVEKFDTGNSSYSITDHGNNRYDLIAENANANNRMYFGRKSRVISA
ncbi:MAG: hypothetical protein N4A61_02030 [Pelagimonas sp.]|jgi:hypothetical protein|nr:hypothetical protein [Pelagimonas sp.]